MNMLKSKRGNAFYVLFLVVLFAIFWSMTIGEMIAGWGQRAIVTNSMVGLEAFFYANINLFIYIFLFLGILAATYGGGQ